MNIPAIITAGDSVSWDDNSSVDNLGNSIDSSAWTLKYDFRQSGVANQSITSSTQGTGWRTTLPAATSALWAAGKLYWQAYATNGSNRVTLGQGAVDILKNIAASATLGAGEFRSQNQQDLDAVQAAMRSMISGGAVQEYTIGGRSLRKISMSDLIMLESKLKYAVAQENKAASIANGQGNPNSVFVRFK